MSSSGDGKAETAGIEKAEKERERGVHKETDRDGRNSARLVVVRR